ncbi:MAG: hypothetical protein QOK47_1446 [Actinomycetota bacterium]|jgi:hypothetical protein|nr:hypothetical protein [Actinomycetota bacterium]
MPNDSQTTHPPFFIVGSARSGTTMLRLTLNSHPHVAVPPESRFVIELWPQSGEVEVDGYLSKLATHRQFQAWHLDVAQIRPLLEGSSRVPYRRAIEATYEAFTRAHGKDRWGDKTPRYVENIERLSELFPEARFVHLVRDGRNVALSYAHTDFGPKTVSKAAAVWKRRVSLGFQQGRGLGAARYLEIRYEELAENNEAVVKEICDFLDIEFDPKMFDEGERAKGAHDRAQRFNPHVTGEAIAKTRAWQEDMPAEQIEVFEAVAGDVLSELGYERRFPMPSAGAKLRARAGLAGLPLDKLEKD